METIIFIVIVGSLILYWRYTKGDIAKRDIYINNYTFPKRLSETLLTTYPHLQANDVQLVIKALRQYFHICNMAGKTMVAMPSQVVDVAWHEFILFTREYESFTQQALGRFLHHTPAEAMKSKTHAQESIKIAWKFACQRENIDPSTPTKLPLIFALDSMLNIEDGFKYSLDCNTKNGAAYCGGDIGCSSGCAGDSDSGNFTDSSSGCGGGCGGD